MIWIEQRKNHRTAGSDAGGAGSALRFSGYHRERGSVRITLWGRLPCALLLLLLSCVAPGHAAPPPGISATASFFLPGLGQYFNGDFGAGTLQLATTIALTQNFVRYREDERYLKSKEQVDEENKLIHTNRTTFVGNLYSTALSNLSLYSSYAAYRDGRLALNNRGYQTPIPEESLGELALAPFDIEYLSRPTTWVALLLPLSLFFFDPNKEAYLYQPDDTISKGELRTGFAVLHETVAIGEESFFRGVLNNSFSNSLGEGWGLLASSVVFGLAHSGTGLQATSLGAGLFGFYLGFLQQHNDYRISEGVALHYWWNVLISLAALRERVPEQRVELANVYFKF